MKTLTYLMCLVLCGSTAGAATAAESNSFVAGKSFACGDYSGKKIFLVGPDGKVVWEYPSGICNELWVLPNGNFLFNTGLGVRKSPATKRSFSTTLQERNLRLPAVGERQHVRRRV